MNFKGKFGFKVVSHIGLFFIAFMSLMTYAAIQTDGPIVGGVSNNLAKVFLRTDEAAFVQVEYSHFPDMTNSTKTAREVTQFASDFTKIISLHDLSPDTKYYYRILVDSQPQQSGPYPSFTTFPSMQEDREFSFALMTDVGNYKKNPAGAYATVASFKPSFMIQIGDWDHRDPGDLRAMRNMHREVRGVGSSAGRDFSRFLAPVTPIFHVWDDHDYGMNDGNYTFSEKASAIQAFTEYFPTPTLANPEAGIWHMFRYAKAEVFMLDTRSNRDPNEDADDENKSMLDGEGIANNQKDWLFRKLLKSTAKWKFITSGSPFNPSCKPSDGWGAFVTEHDEIVNFVKDNNITGVIILSGDIHSGGGFDDGTNSGLVEMTVPHTNMQMASDHTGFTTQKPGTWSEGILSGVDNAGFGWVKVRTNPDRVELEVRGETGELRSSYTVLLDSM